MAAYIGAIVGPPTAVGRESGPQANAEIGRRALSGQRRDSQR